MSDQQIIDACFELQVAHIESRISDLDINASDYTAKITDILVLVNLLRRDVDDCPAHQQPIGDTAARIHHLINTYLNHILD
jgi:hypothetical protein